MNHELLTNKEILIFNGFPPLASKFYTNRDNRYLAGHRTVVLFLYAKNNNLHDNS